MSGLAYCALIACPNTPPPTCQRDLSQHQDGTTQVQSLERLPEIPELEPPAEFLETKIDEDENAFLVMTLSMLRSSYWDASSLLRFHGKLFDACVQGLVAPVKMHATVDVGRRCSDGRAPDICITLYEGRECNRRPLPPLCHTVSSPWAQEPGSSGRSHHPSEGVLSEVRSPLKHGNNPTDHATTGRMAGHWRWISRTRGHSGRGFDPSLGVAPPRIQHVWHGWCHVL